MHGLKPANSKRRSSSLSPNRGLQAASHNPLADIRVGQIGLGTSAKVSPSQDAGPNVQKSVSTNSQTINATVDLPITHLESPARSPTSLSLREPQVRHHALASPSPSSISSDGNSINYDTSAKSIKPDAPHKGTTAQMVNIFELSQQIQHNKKITVQQQPEDSVVSLYQKLFEMHTIDIWLTKRGGEFNIFDGKLIVQPGNYSSRKDFITVRQICAAERIDNLPNLEKHEKLNGQIYDFSTNKKQLKTPVQLWLPCQPVLHPQIQELRLKAKYRGEDTWVNHDWLLKGDDFLTPMMQFSTDKFGTFVATVQPRVESFILTDQGLLYNTKLNHYTSLRFPKKCVDHDITIDLRIMHFSMEKALLLKEDLKMQYPDLGDFEAATDFFEFTSDLKEPFRRPITIKLPTGHDGFTEENKDGLVVMRKDLATNTWEVVESALKITRSTVSFESKSLGRFVILKAHEKRKLRMKTGLPILESKLKKSRRELLMFKKIQKKSWHIWVELVRPSHVTSTIQKRENDGLTCICRPEMISKDVDVQANIPAENQQIQEEEKPPEQTESEKEFTNNLQKNNSATEIKNIYDALPVDSDEAYDKIVALRRPSKKKTTQKKEFSYIEVDDTTIAGIVEVSGPVQTIEQGQLSLFFVESHAENWITFEIEPSSEEQITDLEVAVKLCTESPNPTTGDLTAVYRETKFIITAEQVQDYFWVEPEPEPVVEVPSEISRAAVDQSNTEQILSDQREFAKLQIQRARDIEQTVTRLAAPVRAKIIIPREPRVLSGRSLQTLSRMIEEGLTLAVYLDIPDSTITGIGFDALSNGFSLADVTYRILLRWKRSTKARGISAVEELVAALRGMGRHDIIAVIWEAHHKNQELTPSSFAHLSADEEPNSEDINNNTIKKITNLPVAHLQI